MRYFLLEAWERGVGMVISGDVEMYNNGMRVIESDMIDSSSMSVQNVFRDMIIRIIYIILRW